MTAPNIEMIAASLRNCSLDEGSGISSSPVQLPPTRRPLENVEVTVELNSEVALPYHWEQCLDMRTGEIYFINWKDGTRTTEDPRLSNGYYPETYYSDDDDTSNDDGDSSSDGDGGGGDDFSGDCTTGDSSSYSPEEVTSTDSQILVAAGCKSCFMYFMVPKLDFTCPKCGGHLLHLGRNGCF